jgi:hypothetical protein
MNTTNIIFVQTVREIAIFAQYHDDEDTVVSYFPALMLKDAKAVTNLRSADTLQRIGRSFDDYNEVAAFSNGYSACMNTGKHTVMPHEWKFGCFSPQKITVPAMAEWLRLRNGSDDMQLCSSSTYYAVITAQGLTPVEV